MSYFILAEKYSLEKRKEDKEKNNSKIQTWEEEIKIVGQESACFDETL